MRRLLLLIGALLLLAAPVSAQFIIPTATPTPNAAGAPTPSAQEIQWLGQVLTYAQQTSKSDASTVNTAVILMALFIVILPIVVLLLARILSKPLAGVLQNLQETARRAQADKDEAETQRDESAKAHERELAERNRQRAEHDAKIARSLDQFAASQLRMAEIMGKTESKEDASAGRRTAVDSINQHVTEDGEKTRAALKEVVEKVGEVREVVDKAATVEALDTALQPLKEQVAEMQKSLNEVVRRIGTDELKPPAS